MASAGVMIVTTEEWGGREAASWLWNLHGEQSLWDQAVSERGEETRLSDQRNKKKS